MFFFFFCFGQLLDITNKRQCLFRKLLSFQTRNELSYNGVIEIRTVTQSLAKQIWKHYRKIQRMECSMLYYKKVFTKFHLYHLTSINPCDRSVRRLRSNVVQYIKYFDDQMNESLDLSVFTFNHLIRTNESFKSNCMKLLHKDFVDIHNEIVRNICSDEHVHLPNAIALIANNCSRADFRLIRGQACLASKEIRIINGKATFGRRRFKKKINNGMISGIIASEQFNIQCLNMFYKNIYGACALYSIGEHTVCKNGLDALKVYLYYLINNKMAQGYCPFHASNVKQQVKHICQSYNHQEKSLGISIGESYVWYNCILPLSVTGDGGPVSNLIRNISHLVLLFLHILALGTSINQSIYNGACLLISSLSESSNLLSPIIQQVASTIHKDGTIAIKCDTIKPVTWVCFNYKRWNAADWKFAFTHLNLSVGVTSHFSLIELCLWKDGIPCGVHSNTYYECLMMPYIDPWDVKSFDELQSSNFNGLILSDSDTLKHWGCETEKLVSKRKQQDSLQGKLHLWQDIEYERNQRVNIAQTQTQNGHGIIKQMPIDIDPALTDVAHGFWSFIGM